MDQQRVLLVTSDACGWTDFRPLIVEHPLVEDLVETDSTREAFRLVADTRVDAIICAGRLGGLGTRAGTRALGFVRQLRQAAPTNTRIAVIANEFRASDLQGFAKLNLAAHLLWSDLSTATLNELVTVLLHPGLLVFSERISRAYLSAEQVARACPALPFNVSDGERAFLNGLAASLSHQEIATWSGMSLRTVERHAHDLRHKFDVEGVFALGCMAKEYGLVDERVWREAAREVAETRQNIGG